jgi:flavin-dependent thymidylate synthase
LITEPTITVLAEMSLNRDGMKDLMAWTADYVPDALPENTQVSPYVLFPHGGLSEGHARDYTGNELLVELAGRKCLDGATEVLTKAGWVSFPNLQQGVEVATYNTTSGLIEFQTPTDYIKKVHHGTVYTIESRALSLRATGDHELWREKGGVWAFQEAQELLGKRYRVQRAALYAGQPDAPVSELWSVPQGAANAWATFLGFYLSEGTLVDGKRYGTGSRVTLYQRPETAGPILSAVAALGFEPYIKTDPRNGVLHITVNNTALAEALSPLGHGAAEKALPMEVFDWPMGRRAMLLDALMAGDGTLQGKQRVYSTVSPKLAEGVQRLILLSGRPSSISTVFPKDRPASFRSNLPVHRVREGTQTFVTVNNKTRHDATEEAAGEAFWCVTVPNRTLLVRRRGKTMIVSNCYNSFGKKAGRKTNGSYIANLLGGPGKIPHASVLYHAKMTFFFGGLSRRVSHELIRHYVGADRTEEGCPSQESTRYTHHPGHFTVHPRLLDNDTDMPLAAVEYFREAMQSAYDSYLNFINDETEAHYQEHGEAPKGMDRKRIYECAAQFLPGAAATSFIWTTNPMALQKMFDERCDNASDLEIQRFAKKLRSLCYDRWPNLFRASNPEVPLV